MTTRAFVFLLVGGAGNMLMRTMNENEISFVVVVVLGVVLKKYTKKKLSSSSFASLAMR
jgi:hypothetical protein